jgi:uncharacterized protein YjgD (DUF1641 family)
MTHDELKELIKTTAEGISRIVNAGCREDMQELADLMLRDHRTLLQAKMELCLKYIEGLNDQYENQYYDLRNEQACKIAARICKEIAQYERWMPCI